MGRRQVHFVARVDHEDYSRMIARHKKHHYHSVSAKGFHLGRWLKGAVHTVTHSALGKELITAGATALGEKFGGADGGAMAGQIANSLLPPSSSGPGGAQVNALKKAATTAGRRDPNIQAPPKGLPPPPRPTAAAPAAEDDAMGVRRRKAPAKKKKPAPKRKVKRPY